MVRYYFHPCAPCYRKNKREYTISKCSGFEHERQDARQGVDKDMHRGLVNSLVNLADFYLCISEYIKVFASTYEFMAGSVRTIGLECIMFYSCLVSLFCTGRLVLYIHKSVPLRAVVPCYLSLIFSPTHSHQFVTKVSNLTQCL